MSFGEFFVQFHIELYVSILTLVIMTIITAILKSTLSKLKRIYVDIEHSKGGTLSLLHDRLYQGYSAYLRIGCITCDDLENMDYMYKEYRYLNGNGTCKTLKEKVDELKIVQSSEFQNILDSKDIKRPKNESNI